MDHRGGANHLKKLNKRGSTKNTKLPTEKLKDFSKKLPDNTNQADGNVETSRKESFESNIPGLVEKKARTTSVGFCFSSIRILLYTFDLNRVLKIIKPFKGFPPYYHSCSCSSNFSRNVLIIRYVFQFARF